MPRDASVPLHGAAAVSAQPSMFVLEVCDMYDKCISQKDLAWAVWVGNRDGIWERQDSGSMNRSVGHKAMGTIVMH